MVTLQDIGQAQKRIKEHVIRTPVVFSPTLSAMTGARVWLKLETLQKAGSFKIRGAANRILSTPPGDRELGVVAASAGNHAQGVAVAAHAAGVPAVIVMPEWAGISKQEATRGYGAEVIIHGATLEESIAKAEDLAASGRLFIHPFDDDAVIAGQGTIALEILEDLPDADLIIVPVGGGGLIAGIATAAKALRPGIAVIGVQAYACPSAEEALRQGHPVQICSGNTIADGIRVAGIGERTYPVLQRLVDHVVLADEDAIADAMLLLIERKHVIAEGAGAAPLAALMSGAVQVRPGSTVVLVISGGNVDSALLFRIVKQAMVRQGRILRFSVQLEDRPGSLAGLLRIIADNGGNIIDIDHLPGTGEEPVMTARVGIEVETRGKEHAGTLMDAVTVAGYTGLNRPGHET